VLEKWDTYVV
jgi:hypothetical protein